MQEEAKQKVRAYTQAHTHGIPPTFLLHFTEIDECFVVHVHNTTELLLSPFNEIFPS